MGRVVAPAQATKTRSAFACAAWRANGVKSVAVAGTSSSDTCAPLAPRIAFTAASLPWPKVESWAKTSTFLPAGSPMNVPAVATSW